MALSVEMVATETLHLAGSPHYHRISRSLSKAPLGRLAVSMRYKVEKLEGVALGVPRFFPSSERGACRGAVHADLALGERSWTCSSCGVTLDREHNVANNLP